MINAWYKGKDIRKMCWYPHGNKLLHHIEKCVISNNAINMYSRGPTEQHICTLEPHRECLHEVKKCDRTPSLKRANGAINMHSKEPMEPLKCKLCQ